MTKSYSCTSSRTFDENLFLWSVCVWRIWAYFDCFVSGGFIKTKATHSNQSQNCIFLTKIVSTRTNNFLTYGRIFVGRATNWFWKLTNKQTYDHRRWFYKSTLFFQSVMFFCLSTNKVGTIGDKKNQYDWRDYHCPMNTFQGGIKVHYVLGYLVFVIADRTLFVLFGFEPSSQTFMMNKCNITLKV